MQIEWLKPEEVAQRWRTTPQTIVREIRSSRLPAMPVGRSYRIHRDIIEQREQEGRIVHGKPERPSGIESIPDYVGD